MRLLFSLMVVSTLGSATSVAAQNTGAPTEAAVEDPRVQEARALFERGSELAVQRRFSEAAEAYQRSAELVERPSTLFNLGLCHYALGRHIEALEALQSFHAIADPADDATMIREATEMTSHARRQVGELVLELLPESATVSLNGDPLSGEGAIRRARVNPGTHVVRADAPNHAPVLLEIAIRPGQTVRRAVSLESTFRPTQLAVEARLASEVRIDGQAVGSGSVEREVEPGPHRVSVHHPTDPVFETEIDVEEGETFQLAVQPVVRTEVAARPVWRHPAIWAAVGAVLVGAGVGLGYGLTRDPDPGNGSSGITLMAGGARDATIRR